MDGAGNLTKTIDALDRETSATWEGGRRTSSTDASGTLTKYVLDENGNVVETVQQITRQQYEILREMLKDAVRSGSGV